MTKDRVIAMAGYATAGKDSAAEALINHRGYVRLALADEVRRAAEIINPIIGTYIGNGATVVPYRVQEMVEEFGWQQVKMNNQEARRLLQVIGTELGRNFFGPRTWIDRLLKTAQAMEPPRRIVITDVRFLNEAQALREELGAKIFYVWRLGVGPLRSPDGTIHASEQELRAVEDYSDWIVANDGTLPELHQQVLRFERTIYDD